MFSLQPGGLGVLGILRPRQPDFFHIELLELLFAFGKARDMVLVSMSCYDYCQLTVCHFSHVVHRFRDGLDITLGMDATVDEDVGRHTGRRKRQEKAIPETDPIHAYRDLIRVSLSGRHVRTLGVSQLDLTASSPTEKGTAPSLRLSTPAYKTRAEEPIVVDSRDSSGCRIGRCLDGRRSRCSRPETSSAPRWGQKGRRARLSVAAAQLRTRRPTDHQVPRGGSDGTNALERQRGYSLSVRVRASSHFLQRNSSDASRYSVGAARFVSVASGRNHRRRRTRGQYNEALSPAPASREPLDRKSTRLNSSHVKISYAVLCLKK